MGTRAGLDGRGNPRTYPDSSARSKSLYRLSYSGPHLKITVFIKTRTGYGIDRRIVIRSQKKRQTCQLQSTHIVSKSVRQSVTYLLSQSLRHLVTQSVSQSLIQSVSHLVSQSPSQSVSHLVTQSISHLFSQSLSQLDWENKVCMLHEKQEHITIDNTAQPVINLQLSLRHRISTIQDTIPRCEVIMLSSRLQSGHKQRYGVGLDTWKTCFKMS